MAFIREYRQGDRTYYAEVESYRDQHGDPRQRVVRWLGTSKTPPPEPIPLKGLDFGDLAVKLMDNALAPDDVFDLLERIGKRPATLAELEAVGIRFDLAQKKLWLYLFPKGYDWKVAPPRAPRAMKSVGGKGRAKDTASRPSKAKRN